MRMTQDTKNGTRNLELGGGLENDDGGDYVIGIEELEEQVSAKGGRTHCGRGFHDISQLASSFVRSTTAVCSATVRRDLVLLLLNPYHIISAVTALQAATQLEVACAICCVLRNDHPSIDRPVCPFFGLACSCCWLRLLYF